MDSIEDRYLDQPYELAGRLIDPIGGSAAYRDQRHPLNRKLLEVLACLVRNQKRGHLPFATEYPG